MNKAKRILSVLMCALLLMGTMTVASFAAGSCSITIQDPEDSEATVAGKTFEVYKIFNATTNGANTSYSWNGDKYQEFFADKGVNTVQVAVEYILDQNRASEMDEFAIDIKYYIDTKGIHPDKTVTAGSSDQSVVINDLDYGYYLVYDATDFGNETSAVRSAVMLTTVNKNVTITLKANRPHIEKFVIDNAGNESKGTSSSIGDEVEFRLVTEVPDHSLYGDSYTYKIKDVLPKGMELVGENPISITTNNNEKPTYRIDYNKDITETEKDLKDVPDDQDKWDFVVEFTNMKSISAGTEITVTYKAKLTTDVEKHGINTAMLVYSNDPSAVGESIGVSFSTANIYTYQMVLTKFAQDSNGYLMNKRLAGAEFELYKVVGDTEKKITFSTEPVEETIDGTVHTYTKYIVDPDSEEYTLAVCNEGDETIAMDHFNYGGHRGDITIFGLSEGTYKLKETKAPDGYILPDSTFDIIIEDNIGNLGYVGTLNVTGTHTGTGKIVNTNGIAENILTVWAEITNKPGSALPETGGMGTTLFTVLGIILMAGAVSYVFMKRRRTV